VAKARVEKAEFRAIKQALFVEKFKGRGEDAYRVVAQEHGRSLATVTRIHICKNHDMYKMLVSAEHPPQRTSTLGQRVKTTLALLLNKDILDQGEYELVMKGRRYEHDTD